MRVSLVVDKIDRYSIFASNPTPVLDTALHCTDYSLSGEQSGGENFVI